MAHRASRSEYIDNEYLEESLEDFERAPLQIVSPKSRKAERSSNELVRAALAEHLRQTNELAARLQQALTALDSPFVERALSA
jgi:hypothetical protein